MPLQFSYEVTDRDEVEGIPGLHAELLFRDSDHQRPSRLVGTAEFDDEMMLGTIKLTVDDLGLGKDIGTELIRVVCKGAWNQIVIDGMVAVGVYWVELHPWLLQHYGSGRAVYALFLLNSKLRLKAGSADRSVPY